MAKDRREHTYGTAFFGKIILFVAIIISMPIFIPTLMGQQVYGAIGSIPSYRGGDTGRVYTGGGPDAPTNSLIFVEKVSGEDIKPEDTVLYNGYVNGYDGQVWDVVYICVSNSPETQTIVTKKYSNAEPNITPVPYADIIGRVTGHIPLIGWYVGVFASPTGFAFIVAVYALGIFLVTARGRAKRREAKKARAQAQTEAESDSERDMKES